MRRLISLRDYAGSIITILIAGLTWSLNHLASIVCDPPTIAYSFRCDKVPNDPEKWEAIYTLTNISRQKQFRNLVFEIVSHDPEKAFLANPTIVAMAPAEYSNKAELSSSTTARFPLSSMQPDWSIELHVVEDKKAPVSLIQSYPRNGDSFYGMNGDLFHRRVVDSDDSDTALLLHAGIITWLVSHQAELLLILILVWILLIFIIIFCPRSMLFWLKRNYEWATSRKT